MTAKERVLTKSPSKEEALVKAREEFQQMDAPDQSRFLARLRGEVRPSFVLVEMDSDGSGWLVEAEKLLNFLEEPSCQPFSNEP
jgi:hypothetical protein